MTDVTANPKPADDGLDIVDDVAPSATLDRQADELLRTDEERAFDSPRPLRRAVSEDARAASDWGRNRVVLVRGAIENEPLKSSVVALGVGVLIGLLLRR